MEDSSDDEPIMLSSVASSGKSEQIKDLSHRLLQESLTRQEIDQLYQKLQSEYDNLLAKHALAENTIDQLRIGARVNLFSDSPIPHEAQILEVTENKSIPQPISLQSKDRAVIKIPGVLSVSTVTENHYTGEGNSDSPQVGANSSVIHRLKDLQNDIVAFQSAVADRELSYEEQRNLYNALKDKHDSLKSELENMNEYNGKSSGTNTTHRPSSHIFLDPASLEGELYRLELRLAEVCDDIGDQLHSNRANDSALEQALRDDFQRMRLSSLASENARSRSPPGHHLARKLKNEDRSKHSFEKTSRSNSDLSDPAHNWTPSKDGEGSYSNYDKKDALSPSNEDLAESGYYASESIIRESPKREVPANVPIRYLTRSRSPKEKGSHERSLRRHWSLSAYNSQSESIEEVTLTDEEEHFIDRRKPNLDGQARASNEANVDSQPNDDTSKARIRTRISLPSEKDGSRTAPAATSSPYEEKSVVDMVLTSENRNNRIEPVDEVSTQRKRGRQPIPSNASDRSIVDGKSDGRKSSAKSGSRLTRTRPKQRNCSSSEESNPGHRPERLNSSVYSEQDNVPSLVNLPKSSVHLSRHRPNTAESNLDSGFVGSEGTLKSQDLSNSVKYSGPRRSHQESAAKPGTMKEQLLDSTSFEPKPYTVEATGHFLIERHQESSKRNSPVDRLSEGTGNSRIRSKEKIRPGSTSTARTSSQMKQPLSRVREIGGRKSLVDDVISLHTSPETQTDTSFRRLPVATDKSPFMSEVQASDEEDSPIRATGLQGEERVRGDPLLSVSRASDSRTRTSVPRGDSQSRWSGTRRYRLPSTVSERMHTVRQKPYEEDSASEKVFERQGRKYGRMPKSFDGPSHISKDDMTSLYADRLHEDLQLLRDQLSQLGRMHTIQDPAIRKARDYDKTDVPGNQSYNEIKQKLGDLNDQLRKSLNRSKQRLSTQERGYIPNRDFQELKNKIDLLAKELQRTQRLDVDASESMDHFEFTAPSRLPYSASPRQQPAFVGSQEQLPIGKPHAGLIGAREPLRAYPTQQITHQPQPSFQQGSQTQPTLFASPPTYVSVCPICSDVGYHQHRNYVFKGGPFHTTQGNPAQNDPAVPDHQLLMSPRPTVLQTPASSTRIVTSTPNRPMPNLHSTETSPVAPMPNTIHHIHTIHKQRIPKSPASSSESQSDDEGERHRKRQRNRNQSRSRTRAKLTSRRIDEYNDWRLNDSLNEAAKAATSMEKASRRMLNSLATDLIKSGTPWMIDTSNKSFSR